MGTMALGTVRVLTTRVQCQALIVRVRTCHVGVVGAAVSEPLYAALEWDGNEAFKSTPRAPWKVQPSDTEVAGFVSEIRVGANRFARAVVRRAGHILPADNPAAAFDMIDRFILGRGWE